MPLLPLAGAALRNAALPFMRSLAFRGITNIAEAQRTIRTALGAAPRTQDFYNIYRGFLREVDFASRIKFIPKKFKIPQVRHLIDTWTAPESYRYLARFRVRDNTTGNIVDTFRYIYTRGQRSITSLETEAAKMFQQRGQPTKYGQQEFKDYDFQGVLITAAWHKEGSPWK